MMNVGTILDDNLDVTEQQGKSNSPGNDTDAEGAKISKNGSDDDITIAKSSHDTDKTELCIHGLFPNGFPILILNNVTQERRNDVKRLNEIELQKQESMMNVGTILDDNLDVTEQQGN
ncbi:hypothetical protein Tco_1040091 [Tanacetum coccineum]